MRNPNENNSLYSIEVKKDLSIRKLEKEIIPDLISNMMDKSRYNTMLDLIDHNNYSTFNDLEMIYLFVHQEKDQDEKKNRTKDTKKEYLRDLLWTYHVFITQGHLFDFDSTNVDIYSLLKNLKQRNIRKYQEWLKEVPLGKGGKPYSVATIARKTTIFKSFLLFIYSRNYIQVPLHEYFKSANIHMRDRPNRDISSEEVLQLLNYYKEHPIIYGLLTVLVTTGARIREICNANLNDLSYVDGDYWLKVTGKGNEERELLIYPNVFDAIVSFRKRRGLETIIDGSVQSPIFVTAKHKPYTYKYLSKYLTKAIRKTNLPFIKHRSGSITPHTLRHGFAIISAEEGASEYRIMQTLGHKKLDTTMIYLEKQTKRKNNAAHSWKDSSIINSI